MPGKQQWQAINATCSFEEGRIWSSSMTSPLRDVSDKNKQPSCLPTHTMMYSPIFFCYALCGFHWQAQNSAYAAQWKSSLCRKFASSLTGKHAYWLNITKNSSQERMVVKGEPGYFLATMYHQDDGTTPIFVCLHSSLFICKRQESKVRLHVIINLFYLYKAHAINQRDLRQKYFFDTCLGEWEITMDGSIVLQTWSCWAMSSAVIPFPPNTWLSNSSGIALNNKGSAFLVWSQAASQRGREEKPSFLLWDSKFCLHLMTITCWHWKNQLGVKEHMEALKKCARS